MEFNEAVEQYKKALKEIDEAREVMNDRALSVYKRYIAAHPEWRKYYSDMRAYKWWMDPETHELAFELLEPGSGYSDWVRAGLTPYIPLVYFTDEEELVKLEAGIVPA